MKALIASMIDLLLGALPSQQPCQRKFRKSLPPTGTTAKRAKVKAARKQNRRKK